MRTAMLIAAFAVACTASPAFAQARILTVPSQAPAPSVAPQVQAQMPSAPPAAKVENQTPPNATAQPLQQTQAPTPAPPPAAQATTPDKTPDETPVKTQDQIHSEAQRQDRALPPPLPQLPRGRFSFNRVDNGFLRLDHKSGKVAFCRPQTAGWDCEAAPEDRAALEQEIDQLRDTIAGLNDQVAALKDEIAGLRAPSPPPPPPPPPPPSPRSNGVHIQLPSAADMARARGFLADTWHRLVEILVHLQQDAMRKS